MRMQIVALAAGDSNCACEGPDCACEGPYNNLQVGKADPVPASSLNTLSLKSGDRVHLPDLRDDSSWVAGLNLEWHSKLGGDRVHLPD